MVPSSPAAASVRPSGLKATARTGPLPRRGSTVRAQGCWSATCHSTTCPSQPAPARVRPSGLKATLRTPPPICSGGPAGAPVSVSHSRTDPSALPEASSRPPESGLNARAEMEPEWPCSGLCRGRSEAMSHRMTFWSSPPEAIRWPLALTAVAHTAPWW